MKIDAKRQPAGIVFGGRSPIARSCAISLAERQRVFLITRGVDDDLQSEMSDDHGVTLMEADLAREGNARSVIEKIYDSGFEPTALGFLQRYRPVGELSFEEHSRVEIWSIEESLKTVAELKSPLARVNVLLSSSPAAHLVVDDQDLAYHVVKSGQEALARFYGANLIRENIFVNAVRIGSLVIKERAQRFWDSIPHVVDRLSELSPSQHILDSDEVGARLAGILNLYGSSLSGHVFTVDGGYALLDGASLARAAMEKVVPEA